MQLLIKNTAAQKVIIYVYDKTTFLPITGGAAALTATISKDAGAPVATNDTNPTEIGGGLYNFDLTQAETNADTVAIIVSSTNGNAIIPPSIISTGSAMPDVNVAQISGDSTAADNLELDYDGTGYSKINSSMSGVTNVTNVSGVSYVTQVSGVSRVTLVDTATNVGTITITGVDGYTINQALKLLLAFTVGRASGAGGATLRFRNTPDTLDRITMTVDASGNRSSISLNVT